MTLTELDNLLHTTPWLPTATGIGILLLAAWVTNSFFKRLFLRVADKALSVTTFGKDKALKDQKLIERLANVMPALVITLGLPLVPDVPPVLVSILTNVANAFIILTIAIAISAGLNIATILYGRSAHSHMRPIKGYVQMAKIVIYIVAAILIIATLLDRSPVVLLSGVGAMAAVLMLVFQDTLLSVVASLQISSADMLRKGDWIEMPSQSADGDVIDVQLHTIKVQNWDKTITTIPTRMLVNDSFKNWRGMSESGGRRVKRSLYLNQKSIRFLTEDDIANLRRNRHLKDYLDSKLEEISSWNKQLPEGSDGETNQRRLTNIGTFRAYIFAYLKARDDVSQNMTLMVRQLSPTPQGLPLEVYCFASTTEWVKYEGIQADIFDHLYSVLPNFDLEVFQEPTGSDIKSLARMNK